MMLVNMYFAIFRRRFYKVQAPKAALLCLSCMIALIYIPAQYILQIFNLHSARAAFMPRPPTHRDFSPRSYPEAHVFFVLHTLLCVFYVVVLHLSSIIVYSLCITAVLGKYKRHLSQKTPLRSVKGLGSHIFC